MIGDIISDPIGFLGNLVDGVKAGLEPLRRQHRHPPQEGADGLAVRRARRRRHRSSRRRSTSRGSSTLVMQVLGLTYRQHPRQGGQARRREVVAKMEQTVDVFKILVIEGHPGLWKWIKDKVGDLEEIVIGGIKTFIIEKVIKARHHLADLPPEPRRRLHQGVQGDLRHHHVHHRARRRDHGFRQLDPRLDRRDRQGDIASSRTRSRTPSPRRSRSRSPSSPACSASAASRRRSRRSSRVRKPIERPSTSS